MMEVKSKMPWVEIIDKLTSPDLDKQTLFETLHDALGERVSLRELRLPTMAAVVSLKSIEAVKKAKNYSKNVSKALLKISKIPDKETRKDMLDMLNRMAPQATDYAVIGLNAYLKMDKKHNIEGFYQDYEKYTKEPHQVRAIDPNLFSKFSESRLRA